MRIYKTSTANFLVRAVNSDIVLYDVEFPINKENEFDAKGREILGIPSDMPRNVAQFRVQRTFDFALRLARQGHLIDNLPRAIEAKVKEHFA